MFVEEICLSTTGDEAETDEVSGGQEIVAELEQYNRMRLIQSRFTLFSNQRLMVTTLGAMQPARNYTIDTRILDPQPKRSVKISWGYLLIFALCFIYLVAVSGHVIPGIKLLTFIIGPGAGLSLVAAIYRSHDRLVFYSQHGRVPLVVLFNRLPDRETQNSFTCTLVEYIKEAGTPNTGTDEILSNELKAHRYLMEEGVISAKRYDIVKNRILGQHGSK